MKNNIQNVETATESEDLIFAEKTQPDESGNRKIYFIDDVKLAKEAVKYCREELKAHEASVKVDHWRNYYEVFRFYRHPDTQKTERINMFTLECGTEGFNECVNYIIEGTVYYQGGSFADSLLAKTALLYEIQESKKRKSKQRKIEKQNVR